IIARVLYFFVSYRLVKEVNFSTFIANNATRILGNANTAAVIHYRFAQSYNKG
ncbi:hypothetical protein EV356DRAFT_458622, partial [Viridothelium virens]